MSYLNQLIRRSAPATRCQCAIMAVLTEKFSSVDEIWRRGAVYAENAAGIIGKVAYGTISAVLRGLAQQGFAERRGKQYRSASVRQKALDTQGRESHTKPSARRGRSED